MAEKAQSRMDSLVRGRGRGLDTSRRGRGQRGVDRPFAGERKRPSRTRFEHPPSGFSVLDPGSVPELPIQNKAKPVIFGAMSLVGLFCGLAFALWREFRGLRLQTPAEIAFWGSGPVLAATPWPSDPLGLDELVAGLDDLAPEATGNLLLLGGTPDDASSARELARCYQRRLVRRRADGRCRRPSSERAKPASERSPHDAAATFGALSRGWVPEPIRRTGPTLDGIGAPARPARSARTTHSTRSVGRPVRRSGSPPRRAPCRPCHRPGALRRDDGACAERDPSPNRPERRHRIYRARAS